MNTKTPEQTAAAAEEAYAHPDDEGGEIVAITTSPALSTVVSVRLNAEDLAELEAAAARAGQKLSSYLRASALAAARQRVAVPGDLALRLLAEVESVTQEVRQQIERITVAGSGAVTAAIHATPAPARAVRVKSSTATKAVRNPRTSALSARSQKTTRNPVSGRLTTKKAKDGRAKSSKAKSGQPNETPGGADAP